MNDTLGTRSGRAWSRRTALTAGGSLLTAGLAGCLGGGSATAGGASDGTADADGPLVVRCE